jgi:hypothetical protein
VKVQDIIQNKQSGNTFIRSSLWQVKPGRFKRCIEFFQWLWFCYLRLIFVRVLAVILALMSLLIVWGETTLFFDTTLSLIPYCLRYIYGELWIQLYCLCPLLYLVVSTYLPLFELKLKGRYGLYSNNHTDPANLIWSACFMARLIPALSFNFVLLVEVQGTQFRSVMKVVDLVPYLGNDLAEVLPMLLIIFCLLNTFNIHTRIMNSIGLPQLSFTEILDPSRIAEGRSLIEKARMLREKKIREASTYSKRLGQSEDAVKDLKKPFRP